MSTPSCRTSTRQRVGVGVRGDGQEPVRPAVAPAPDLRAVGRRRPEQDQAGVGERVAALVGPAGRGSAAHGERAEHGRRHGPGRSRPPGARAEQRRPGAEQSTAQRVELGVVEHERPSLVAVALPRGAPRDVQDGGGGVQACRRSAAQVASPRAVCRRRRASAAATSASSSDEAVVVGGQLAVQAAREGVGGELALEQRGGVRPATARTRRTRGRRTQRPAARRPRR